MSDGAQVGTCTSCGQQLILTPDDCWHPYNVAVACPPEIDTGKGWPEPQWGRFGRPGREYFVADEVQPE